ncbi:hypothetical protein Zm00014a_026021 [Zea mays]|jgi:hypothetical protein|uniref:Uncharacterized protein n=2 Tax=Zea mays TaxID=4577 RepID=A0A8J8XLL1_MAIZE|nr:uncharacterized protein LOC109941645 [Zea mays]AQK97933.1 hypothetical protein ZEAMMB73_Zm00001d011752 [Zea mays]PWZ10450.1 hypothetical protein Zm00014a_026021 [Zea mays]|eukprot:XP_020398407.1 uncharacterized protein LOC109941645 [Zea mays]
MSQNAAWAQAERRPLTDPIEIPAATSAARVADRETDAGGEAAAPPHVLLARRGAAAAAASVCSGQGRTLKGRDLRRVRDSVLRMTGFIET